MCIKGLFGRTVLRSSEWRYVKKVLRSVLFSSGYLMRSSTPLRVYMWYMCPQPGIVGWYIAVAALDSEDHSAVASRLADLNPPSLFIWMTSTIPSLGVQWLSFNMSLIVAYNYLRPYFTMRAAFDIECAAQQLPEREVYLPNRRAG